MVTGGVVRVTGSGLGCPQWPSCEAGRVIPAGGATAGWHQAVEFGNRLLTFVVLAVAVATFLAAWRIRGERPQLLRLAALLPLGVLAQAVLGGVTVLTGLHPLVVAAHFLVSMGLLAAATALHHATRAERPPLDHGSRWLARIGAGLLLASATVLVLGTVVTAAGPHAGDPGTQRLAVPIRLAVRLHTGAMWTTVGLTVVAWLLAHPGGHGRVRWAATWLLVIEAGQATVGYVQYALGLPRALVVIHLLLACTFWIVAVRLWLRARDAAPARVTRAVRPAPAGTVTPVGRRTRGAP